MLVLPRCFSGRKAGVEGIQRSIVNDNVRLFHAEYSRGMINLQRGHSFSHT